jgi:hypothetical protein
VLTVVIWLASEASRLDQMANDATPSKTTITMATMISPYSIVDCARGQARARTCAPVHIVPRRRDMYHTWHSPPDRGDSPELAPQRLPRQHSRRYAAGALGHSGSARWVMVGFVTIGVVSCVRSDTIARFSPPDRPRCSSTRSASVSIVSTPSRLTISRVEGLERKNPDQLTDYVT